VCACHRGLRKKIKKISISREVAWIRDGYQGFFFFGSIFLCYVLHPFINIKCFRFVKQMYLDKFYKMFYKKVRGLGTVSA
jgi:hypothetical protein